jgi:hypothetical protein
LLLAAAEPIVDGLAAAEALAGIKRVARLLVRVFRFPPQWGQAVLAQTAAARHLTHYHQPAEVVVVLIFPQEQAGRARGTGQLPVAGAGLPVLRGKATTAALWSRSMIITETLNMWRVEAAVRVPLAEMAPGTRMVQRQAMGVRALHGRTERFMRVVAVVLCELLVLEALVPAAEVRGVVVAQRLTEL